MPYFMQNSRNIVWQDLAMRKPLRLAARHHRAVCVWLTGLSGAGKSTIANHLELKLAASGAHTYILDGDNLRHGLNKDLGFSDADRSENIRRVAEVAKLMVDAGLIVIVSLISPFSKDRESARALFAEGKFVEVFVDASLAECEKRDAKGLYKKTRNGEILNFTGIDSPYETPVKPEITVNSEMLSVEDSAMLILEHIRRLI